MSDLKKIKDEFLLKLSGKLEISEINQIKSELFGKSGLISTQFKKIGTIAESERKKFASDLNIIKDELQNLISSKINEVENVEINPLLPNRSDLIWFISEISNFSLSFEINSSFIFLRSDIFTDYFFREIKQ